MDLEIDFWKLLLEFGKKKLLLLPAIGLGIGSGLALSAYLEKKYSSETIFVEDQDEADQGMPNLGLLSGSLGIKAGSKGSPLLANFEEVVKTRNFMSMTRKVIFEDTSFPHARALFKDISDEGEKAFYSALPPLVETKKKNDLYHLAGITGDSLQSLDLAKALFRAFDSLIYLEKRKAVEENYEFIQGLVTINKRELEDASERLMRFLEKNRDVGSPMLEKERRDLLLNVKLAEEKYIISVKELEGSKVKRAKKSRNLTVFESPYLNPSPVFPDTKKLIALCCFLSFFLWMGIIAFLTRRNWIVLGGMGRKP